MKQCKIVKDAKLIEIVIRNNTQSNKYYWTLDAMTGEAHVTKSMLITKEKAQELITTGYPVEDIWIDGEEQDHKDY